MTAASDKTERKFLMEPAIIDWLQWCDELETPLGKPDYPQLALALIAEYKSEIKRLKALITKQCVLSPSPVNQVTSVPLQKSTD